LFDRNSDERFKFLQNTFFLLVVFVAAVKQESSPMLEQWGI